MARRQCDQYGVVQQRLQVELLGGVGVLFVGGDHREVDGAVGEQVQQVGGEAFGEADRDLRVRGAEGGERAGDEGGVGAVVGAHPQAAGGEFGERGQVAAGGVEAFEHRLGVRQQGAAVLGQPDPAGQAVEQRGAQLGFQGGDLAGDRGLGVAQPFSGGGEGAEVCDGAEDVQPSHVHSAWLPCRTFVCRLAGGCLAWWP